MNRLPACSIGSLNLINNYTVEFPSFGVTPTAFRPLTFDVDHTNATGKGHRSFGFKDRVKTNGRTGGQWTEAIALPNAVGNKSNI